MAYDDHWDEDGRCGYCYEEWPCEGVGSIRASGVHKWQLDALNREYAIKRSVGEQEEQRINELFVLLGMPMMVYPSGSQTMTIKRTQVLQLLERWYDERQEHSPDEVGRPSDVRG